MPKTSDLPGISGTGVAPVRIKAVDDAAEEYVKVRDRRMGLTKKEVQAKQNLIDIIHKNAEKIGADNEGIMRYEYDDVVVELSPGKEQLKVRTATNPAGDAE
jgi:rare lipoprotein A (peptidoglycan hydrolase)